MGDGLPPDLVQLPSTLPIRALVLGSLYHICVRMRVCISVCVSVSCLHGWLHARLCERLTRVYTHIFACAFVWAFAVAFVCEFVWALVCALLVCASVCMRVNLIVWKAFVWTLCTCLCERLYVRCMHVCACLYARTCNFCLRVCMIVCKAFVWTLCTCLCERLYVRCMHVCACLYARIWNFCISVLYHSLHVCSSVCASPSQELRNRCKRMDAAGDEEDQAAELEKTAHQVRDKAVHTRPNSPKWDRRFPPRNSRLPSLTLLQLETLFFYNFTRS